MKIKYYKRSTEISMTGTWMAVSLTLAMMLPAQAALVFEKPKQEFTTVPKQEKVELEYAFENKGTNTVLITGIASTCGCTVPTLEKKEYRPGEKGVIKTIFTIGGRQGLQEKKILVTTDDPAMPSVELVLSGVIPKTVDAAPEILIWKVGDTPETKFIDVNIAPGENLKILEAKSLSFLFKPTLKVIEEGKKYQIGVTPTDTSKPAFVAIQLNTTQTNRQLNVLAQIQP